MHLLPRHLLTGAMAVALLAGCSSGTADDSARPSASSADTIISIDNCGQQLTLTEVPSRVVILGGASVAEVNSFLALGIEDSIIANLQTYGVSDDPDLVEQIAALPTGDLTLNDNFGPPAEQLLALRPDLVVSTYPGAFDADLGFATRDELAAAGANTLISPTNCANGNPDATPEEQEVYDTTGIDGSYQLLHTLGEVFRVQDRAQTVVDQMQSSIDATAAAIEGQPDVNGIVLSPGFGTEVPTAWTGGIFTGVLAAAGVQNVFAGDSAAATGTYSVEQLLASDPDVVVLWGDGSVDIPALQASVEQQFPSWPAVVTGSFVTVFDGVYLGPTNPQAVDKIARVAHPDAF